MEPVSRGVMYPVKHLPVQLQEKLGETSAHHAVVFTAEGLTDFLAVIGLEVDVQVVETEDVQ